MKKNDDIREIQEELLWLLPQWNSRIAKPFKQLLDEGISIEMYYCMRLLHWMGGIATMTELGNVALIPKQNMTKMVNRMVEQDFVERVYDPKNRRIIRIKLTDKSCDYINHFLDEDAGCFKNLLQQMDENDLAVFGKAIKDIFEIFNKLSILPLENGSEGE